MFEVIDFLEIKRAIVLINFLLNEDELVNNLLNKTKEDK